MDFGEQSCFFFSFACFCIIIIMQSWYASVGRACEEKKYDVDPPKVQDRPLSLIRSGKDLEADPKHRKKDPLKCYTRLLSLSPWPDTRYSHVDRNKALIRGKQLIGM